MLLPLLKNPNAIDPTKCLQFLLGFFFFTATRKQEIIPCVLPLEINYQKYISKSTDGNHDQEIQIITADDD